MVHRSREVATESSINRVDRYFNSDFDDIDEIELSGEGRRAPPSNSKQAPTNLFSSVRASYASTSDQHKRSTQSDVIMTEVIEMDREQHPQIVSEERFVELANRESDWLSPLSDSVDQAFISKESTLESVPCLRETDLENETRSKQVTSRSSLKPKRRTQTTKLKQVDSHRSSHDESNIAPRDDLHSGGLPLQLERLSNLHMEGKLTEQEFTLAKKTVLESKTTPAFSTSLCAARRSHIRASCGTNQSRASQKFPPGQYNVLDPSRNSLPAPLCRFPTPPPRLQHVSMRLTALVRSGDAPPSYDCEKSDASVQWLRKQQLRTCFRAHVSGQSYDTRSAPRRTPHHATPPTC